MSKPQGPEPGEGAGRFQALREPVGPKDRSVYVRRRIIVLLAFLALIVAIVLIIVKPGSGSVERAEDVRVPTDLAETPTASASDDADTPACDLAKLRVTAVTDQGSYGPGELPMFSLSVENTGDAACIADLGTGGMAFVVSSGDDQVWRSVDCQTNPASTPVILDPGAPVESEAVSWDRTRSSAETCDLERDPVIAGGASYHLRATAGGAESEETAQFLLF